MVTKGTTTLALTSGEPFEMSPGIPVTLGATPLTFISGVAAGSPVYAMHIEDPHDGIR